MMAGILSFGGYKGREQERGVSFSPQLILMFHKYICLFRIFFPGVLHRRKTG